VRDLLALTARSEVISFAGGLPAPELLDAAGIRRAYDEVLAGPPAQSLQYSATEGDPDLRGALAARLGRHGLPTDLDDLLVTTGSQQALTLLTMALLDPGDVVAVEDPTYLAALQCFGLAGARVVAVPTDDDGVRPDDLDVVIARHRPRLLYLVPTFQNPTGRTMPAHRRRTVAEIAAHHGLWIVEDDPYGELRYDGAPEPWIAAEPAAADRNAPGLAARGRPAAAGLRDRQAGHRPAHLDDRPGRRRPVPRRRADAPSGGDARRLPRATRRDARRAAEHAAPGQPVDDAARRHVRLGPPPRGVRRRRAAARGSRPGCGLCAR
jgi:2-aminoadipate transaminase